MQTLSSEENMLWIDKPSHPDSAKNQSSIHIALVFLVIQHNLRGCNQKSNQNQNLVFKQCTWGQKKHKRGLLFRPLPIPAAMCTTTLNEDKKPLNVLKSFFLHKDNIPSQCPDADELCPHCSMYNPPQEVSHPPINRSHIQDPPTALWGKVKAEIPKQRVVVHKLNSAKI